MKKAKTNVHAQEENLLLFPSPVVSNDNLPAMPDIMEFYGDIPCINVSNAGHTHTEPFKKLTRQKSGEFKASRSYEKLQVKLPSSPNWFSNITGENPYDRLVEETDPGTSLEQIGRIYSEFRPFYFHEVPGDVASVGVVTAFKHQVLVNPRRRRICSSTQF